MSDLELFSWGPGLDLPSFDPFCLSIAAYLNMSGASWVMNECHSPSVSPTGELPMLRMGAEPVAGTHNIIQTLKSKGLNLDQDLTDKERAESNAFVALIENKLHDALLYSQWMESANYVKSTHPTFAKSLTYVDRFQIPAQIKSRVAVRLRAYRNVKIEGKVVPEAYLAAREAYAALAVRLGDKPYFFGDRPSTLDAVAFGHLAVHAYPSLAVPKLFSLLTFEFPTLIAYTARLKDHIFSTPLIKSPNTRPSLRMLISGFLRDPASHIQQAWEAIQIRTAPTTERTKEKRVQAFWKGASVVGAIAFFVGYVFSNGIIQVVYVDEHDVTQDEEDEEDHEGSNQDAEDEDDKVTNDHANE